MASRGIAGKVAVVAMGCSRFGERWDSSTDDLLVEAVDATRLVLLHTARLDSLRVLLVTSANLTQSGIGKNIEAGLLVRGGAAPARATEHVRELQSTGVLERMY